MEHGLPLGLEALGGQSGRRRWEAVGVLGGRPKSEAELGLSDQTDQIDQICQKSLTSCSREVVGYEFQIYNAIFNSFTYDKLECISLANINILLYLRILQLLTTKSTNISTEYNRMVMSKIIWMV